jgi:hypothetical protein
MNKTEIVKLRALAKKATPGPWVARLIREAADPWWSVDQADQPESEAVALTGEADAAYIVALVNAAPALLDAASNGMSGRAEGLEAALERLKDAAPSGNQQYNHGWSSAIDAALAATLQATGQEPTPAEQDDIDAMAPGNFV